MALSKELIAPVAGVGSRDDANGLPPRLSSFAPGRAHRSASNEDCAAQHDDARPDATIPVRRRLWTSLPYLHL